MYNAEELYKLRIHEEAVAMERVNFTKTDRRINPVKVNPFIYREGNIPILVSAPHSVRYVKQKKIKVSDEFTGSTALILNKLTGCHSLAVSKLYGGDPNIDKKCFYKDYLKEMCQKKGIKLVIDLHGCSREMGLDISIDTLKEATTPNSLKLKKEVICLLKENGFEKVVENAFKIEDNSVSRFLVQDLGIMAFKLEVNKKYRVPHQNGQSFCKLLNSLILVLNSLKNNI